MCSSDLELPVESDGRLKLAALADALAEVERPLVSIMLANNETGVIQPVAEAAALVHAAAGLLHVDAVQAAGRIACDVTALGADLMTLSAHKIGGPQGVGALIRSRDDMHFLEPLIRGGGQERGSRAGTEMCQALPRSERLRKPRVLHRPKKPPACWRCDKSSKKGCAPSRPKR